MKRIFQILLALLMPTGILSVSAYNLMKWDAPVNKMTNKIIKHPDKKKKLPPDCAILRVKILPIIPPDFNLEDKTGGQGRDLKEFKYVNRKENYFEFYYQINPDNPIRTLQLQADKYVNHGEKEVFLEPQSCYETTIMLDQEDWVIVKLKTDPGNCDIYEEGKRIGQSDAKGFYVDTMKMSKAFLFSFKKEGYEPVRKTVAPSEMIFLNTGEFDTINMVINIKETYVLERKGAAKREKVNIRTQAGSMLYLRNNMDEEYGAGIQIPRGGLYQAELTEGMYTVKITKEGYYEKQKTFNVSQGIGFDETLMLDPITGTLSVKSSPKGADVLIDGKLQGETPFLKEIPIGNHILTLKKRSYATLDSISITVDTVSPTKKKYDLSRTGNSWWTKSQFFPHHYIEAYYGMGITSDKKFNHYIGGNYTYIRHALGFNLSAMYGFNNKDIVATAGPALTLTKQNKTDLDLQLLLGAGYASILREKGSSRTGTWVAEAGLRFGFENAITSYPVSLWSIFMGAKYYDKKVVPTLGISLIPVGILALDYFKEETEYSHVFLDPMIGYAVKSHDLMAGGHFAWQKYNIGFYTSFMYGVFHKNIAAIAGPALHITPNSGVFDLTLYGGAGYGRTEYGTHHAAGDFGLRFGFGDDVFNWYNFSLGCTTYAGEWIPTFGLSLLPIKGLVELAKIEEFDFPSHYTEAMAAYCFGRREWLVGANYSWILTHLGVYGSFLVGLKHSATINVGPVFRLTPDDCVVDLQLYQGMGWTKFGNHSMGGESGIRMGFRLDGFEFGLFSLNAGANYTKHDVAISFGVSWVLALTGGLGACAAAMF